jgi:acetyl-CoA synthetase
MELHGTKEGRIAATPNRRIFKMSIPVIPSPDSQGLVVPKAFIALAPGSTGDRATALSIFQHMQQRIAPVMRVRGIEFVPDLPKTISGKIRRDHLRAV